MIDMPPPAFTALRPDLPVTIYQRHLPHWRQEGATYFVTFRLADSLPQAKLDVLRDEMEDWRRNHPNPSDEERDAFVRDRMQRIEKWLDAGHGSCILRQEGPRREVESCLQHFNDKRYILGAYSLVANHAHVAVRPLGDQKLEVLDGAWKRYSAIAINQIRGSQGTLWQEESFDRIIRDTPHLRKVVRYIEKNVEHGGSFWLRPDWREWFHGE